jgi:broad-specificity NMP kinase
MVEQIRRMISRWRFGEPVIIVSGLPRSGTSMMMKMLEAGGLPILTDRERKADEDNPKGYFEYEKVKELDKNGDKEWVSELRGSVVKIISELLKHLPANNNYKVVFMLRNLDEVLASQNKMLKRRDEEVKSEADQQMKELFDRHLFQIKFWLKKQTNFEVLYLSYSEILSHPAENAKRLKIFFNRNLDAEKMAQVVDPKLYRNRATPSKV